MSKFIKLHGKRDVGGKGNLVLVNVNAIKHVLVSYDKSRGECYTKVRTSDEVSVGVKETVEEVWAMLNDTPNNDNDAQRDRLSRRMDVEQENNQYEEVSFDGASKYDHTTIYHFGGSELFYTVVQDDYKTVTKAIKTAMGEETNGKLTRRMDK